MLMLFSDLSNSAPTSKWKLPKELNEVSGLTAREDLSEEIFMLDDEKAIIYAFNLTTEVIRTVLKIQNKKHKTVKGDFEGIALLDDDFYLITSKGRLYKAANAAEFHEQIVEKHFINTGLAKTCELEGLSAYQHKLYMVCKSNYRKKDRNTLLIFCFDPATAVTKRWLRLPLGKLGIKSLNPSGIVVSNQEIHLVSAIQHSYTKLTFNGTLISHLKLSKKKHRQVEGITLWQKKALIFADEGRGRGGKITLYRNAL